MRPGVAESRPPGNLEAVGARAVEQGSVGLYGRPYTQPEFPTLHPPRKPAQPATRKLPQHHLSLTPGEGWLALLLLAVAVYSVVFSIISANWVSNSYILLLSTAIGLLLGLGIAKIQRFPQTILHLAACLAGHWLSILLTSMLAFHISWLRLLENLRAVISGGLATTNSEMVFLFYLTFLCFFLGYFGAWLIYRAHLPWLVAFVYCAIMLVNLNYSKQDISYLVIIMLGALILLIARIQLVNQVTRWIQEGLYADHAWQQDISRRFVHICSLFTLLILLISWILPLLAQPVSGASFWTNLDNLWTNVTHGQLSLSDPGTLFQQYQPPASFFGDQLVISGNVSLPAGEVLYYTTSATPQAQYLEGFTYDHFDGHTWTSSNESQQFPANTRLPVDTSGNFNQATTTVTIVFPPESTKHYLFAPSQPWSFSVSTVLYGNGIITAWTQQDPLTRAERYQVTSLISSATAQDLSTVPFPRDVQNLWSNDPDISTLKGHYLQIPGDLPSSVQKTVQQWTHGSTNVYQAIKQIESHLSDPAHFRYSVSNPPVPSNEDAVAWLLQTQQGYCTYYATAMTIMARMLGIPARVVNGFSQGHFDPQRKVWAVDGQDAHSWVQVYFPGFGWINFDPTPGFSINGGSTAQPGPTPVQTQPPASPTSTAAGHQKPGPQHRPAPGSTGTGTTSTATIARQNLFLGLSLAILCGSLIVLAFALFVRFKDSRPNTSTTVSSTIFWRICRFGRLVGLPPQRWLTPYEYSRVLGRRFPQAAASLRRVTELFVRERWAAPHEIPGPAEQQALEKLWPHLRNTFIRSLFLKWTTRMKL
jgi:transglutaminase-like putative cysteine protease